ncbi:hypothetical protein B0H13DRAFT_1868457 [Mycena leptocephala]|nr:hypothetical protein B0H13DRAFT_1868457 [Mycena leptocephala]
MKTRRDTLEGWSDFKDRLDLQMRTRLSAWVQVLSPSSIDHERQFNLRQNHQWRYEGWMGERRRKPEYQELRGASDPADQDPDMHQDQQEKCDDNWQHGAGGFVHASSAARIPVREVMSWLYTRVSLCVGYALGIPYVGALARSSLPLAFFHSAFYPPFLHDLLSSLLTHPTENDTCPLVTRCRIPRPARLKVVVWRVEWRWGVAQMRFAGGWV